MNCSLLEKRAGRADGAKGVGLEKDGSRKAGSNGLPGGASTTPLCHAGGIVGKAKVWRLVKLCRNLIRQLLAHYGWWVVGATCWAQNSATARRRSSAVPVFGMTTSACRRFSSTGHWAASRRSNSASD